MNRLEKAFSDPFFGSIIKEEYARFKEKIKNLEGDRRFYVYSLRFEDGQPFYFGKGCGDRAWNHIKEYFGEKNKSNALKHEVIEYIIEKQDSFPIVFLDEIGLTEQEAIDLEKEMISKYGRATEENGILCNLMPGGFEQSHIKEIQSYAGKIGGAIARDTKVGIHAEDYDHSSQSKLNWELGLLDHINFVENGRVAGTKARDEHLGIHRLDLVHMRTEWAKIGAAALEESGNRGGVCSQKWRDDNPERFKEIAANGGRVGGKTTGAMLWWNNGEINRKGFECPGEGFVRGMLMSEKKRKQVYEVLHSHNKRKDSN